MKWILAAILFIISTPLAVFAHDMWIEKTPAGPTLFYGHKYGHKHSQHEGAELVEYSAYIIVRADCFDAGGAGGPAVLGDTSPVTIGGPCAAVFVLTSTGIWSKTPYGTKNIPKTEADNAIKSWLSFESVKRIDAWGEPLSRPLTENLEITPVENPLILKNGKKLRLLVTFEGQPVSGVAVGYDGEPRGVTDKDGRINIKLRHGGFQLVQASLHRPYESPEADEVIHTTNLNFETEQ